MSTRCSIACTPKVHIYSCCNSNWDVFICDSLFQEPREGYNDDIRLGHAELRELYEQLKKYFESGAEYEKFYESDAQLDKT